MALFNFIPNDATPLLIPDADELKFNCNVIGTATFATKFPSCEIAALFTYGVPFSDIA